MDVRRENFSSILAEPVSYLCVWWVQVDASTFGKDFASRQPLAARPDLGDGGNLRPIVDLLVC